MSNTAIDWAYAQELNSSSAKAVLTALAHHRNQKTGQCFPGRALIAEETELSRDTIRKAIRRLERAGLIKVEPVFAKSGRRRGTQYELHLQAGRQPAQVVELRADGGRSASPTTGGPSAPNRKEEPEKNRGVPSKDRAGDDLSAYDKPVKR